MLDWNETIAEPYMRVINPTSRQLHRCTLRLPVGVGPVNNLLLDRRQPGLTFSKFYRHRHNLSPT